MAAESIDIDFENFSSAFCCGGAMTSDGVHADVPGTILSTTEADLHLLMVAARAGSVDAQGALLSACAVLLRAYYGRRMPWRAADVEDLVQETLIVIHYCRESYDPGSPFMAWLHGIARYKLVDHHRRAGRRVTVPLADAPEDILADEGSGHPLAGVDIERLLALLPPKQAAAIRLTRLEGLAVREAAASPGQSAASVKVGVHRGLQKLAALWRGKGS